MRKLIPILLSSSLLNPASCYALGLGGIKVKSALYEPFQADIQLISVNSLSLNDIQVNLASDKEFGELAIDKSTILTKLQFNVIDDDAGNRIIRITSTDKISEPYLNILLHVNWPMGDFLRAYTVLLDPPSYEVASQKTEKSKIETPATHETLVPITVEQKAAKDEKPELNVLKPTVKVTEEKPSAELSETLATKGEEKIVETKIVPVQQEATQATKEEEPIKIIVPSIENKSKENMISSSKKEIEKIKLMSPMPKTQNTVSTKHSDSLWVIAKRIAKGTNLTISQTMLAIAWANPQAFKDGNINRMKTGEILQIPSTAEIRTINDKQAQHEVNAHYQAWQKHSVISHVMQPSLKLAETSAVKPVSENKNSETKNAPSTPVLSMKNLHPQGIESNPELLPLKDNLSNDIEKKLRAELALAMEETARVKDTNEVMQEQFAMLQEQNQSLQNQLMQRSTELEILKKQTARWEKQITTSVNTVVDKRPGITGQANVTDLAPQQSYWSKLFYALATLISIGGIGGALAWLFNRNRKATKEVITESIKHFDPAPKTTAYFENLAGEDFIATKLDLATAYITMEEYKRAKEILNEIKNQGSATQQQEAARLLGEIAEVSV